MALPYLLWSRSMAGEGPGVLLGCDRVLLHLTVTSGRQTVTELLCFDFEGRPLWSRPGLTGLLSLPGRRFLVSTPAGEPLILDGSGETLRRWFSGGITWVARHGGQLLFADARHVWAADLGLNWLWQLTWPAGPGPAVDCFVGGAFYWAEQNEVKFCTRGGRTGTFARLPGDTITGAMDRYERARGASGLLLRDFPGHWRLSFDESRGLFFLARFLPHLVLCLDRLGRARWCECLGPGCCGGVPYPLPNGLYGASGGWNGILSWLDPDGNVLFQSRPHEGVGLATIYSSELLILPDGRVLVAGGPGLVGYSMEGELLWTLGRGYAQFHCDPARGILVGWHWEKSGPDSPNRICLEFVGGV